ncbi:pirin family protein [Nodularia sphaerocarpa]|uniref:pirin family protein n=1 Tax=Nodularia sphaerocarpa TaxID=137816 RepID=UPI001EFA64CC|nr:pirin family protein [Nodularia sphaerocarpa]MDB9373922.1 pirin family protein [Nodularia sphaerocarpa CS-585]MDB9376993.1 pirin family protein [Nodularia sphaerocarpa CS-585A2]ULP72185.1 Quercetin 2,3-dioxygenase [Nodularia sphaerocarpa UHCC 0038]
MSQNTIKYLIHDRNARGHAEFGWLDSYHTFSFGNFYDRDRMGFRTLRVINDDRIAPGAGFPRHSHRDMEILTYVLSGAVEHKDSLGTGSIIRPGDAQIMSAGTGIAHSEFNPSQTEPLHLLQIWILPNKQGLTPRYEQKSFPIEEKRGQLRLIAGKDGRDGAVTIHQDIDLYASILDSGDVVNYHVKPDRYAWLQIAQGVATLNGEELRAGDGVQISGEEKLQISTEISTELLLFDLG